MLIFHNLLTTASILHSLVLQLKANFDCKRLEEFPPKHWRSTLSDIQLDERRSLLERFMHSVMQDRVISISDMLKEFLVATQKVTLLYDVIVM